MISYDKLKRLLNLLDIAIYKLSTEEFINCSSATVRKMFPSKKVQERQKSGEWISNYVSLEIMDKLIPVLNREIDSFNNNLLKDNQQSISNGKQIVEVEPEKYYITDIPNAVLILKHVNIGDIIEWKEDNDVVRGLRAAKQEKFDTVLKERYSENAAKNSGFKKKDS